MLNWLSGGSDGTLDNSVTREDGKNFLVQNASTLIKEGENASFNDVDISGNLTCYKLQTLYKNNDMLSYSGRESAIETDSIIIHSENTTRGVKLHSTYIAVDPGISEFIISLWHHVT